MSRWICAALLCSLLSGVASGQEPGVTYTFDLTIDADANTLRGAGELRYRNDTQTPVVELPLLLYGARFRTLDRQITDQNFSRFYVRFFDPGDMVLDSVSIGGQALTVRRGDDPALPPGSLMRVRLPAPLPPGATLRLHLAYTLTIPERLGTFGFDRDRFVLDGGALPTLAVDPLAPPPNASYDLAVSWSGAPLGPVVVAGREVGKERVRFQSHSPSLLAGEDVTPLVDVGSKGDAPGVRVYGEEGDDDRAKHIARVAQKAGSFFHSFLPRDAPTGSVTFAEAPLRDRFTQVTDDVVLTSDRLFHLFIALERFHEFEVGRATIQALTRQHLRDVPLGADRDWVCEAVSWFVAAEWIRGRQGIKGSTVRAGLDWLSFIPAFDRLVRAPRFAGSDLFYGRFYESAESVRDAYPRSLSGRARGRVALEKLRDKVGSDRLREFVKDLLGDGAAPKRAAFRRNAAKLAGEDLSAFFDLWLGPPPVQNLIVDEVDAQDRPDGTQDVTVTIRRDGDVRPGEVGEPVQVEVEGPDEERIRLRWAGTGMRGEVSFRGKTGLFAPIELDPNLRILQTRHNDDKSPYFPVKILFNRLRVRIDLNRGNRNEAAVGMTLHPFHDYQHSVKVDAFYEQDERGLALTYGYGFGTVVDERSYGASLNLGVVAQTVNSGVLQNTVETEGELLAVGAGVSFDTRVSEANPTWGFGISAAASYSDTLFDTDFRFTTYTGSIAFVWSIVRGTQIAGEVVLGQIEGNKRIPSQRLFDAGGSGAVRGVKTSKFNDTAVLVLRGELRHILFTDLDIPVLWLTWLRRVQLVAFLDAGDVGPTVDKIVTDDKVWKWGAGGGIRIRLDSFGVAPLTLRFDVGVRFDEKAEDNDPQFYVGAGQSF